LSNTIVIHHARTAAENILPIIQFKAKSKQHFGSILVKVTSL
jgi:hypothetical protein